MSGLQRKILIITLGTLVSFILLLWFVVYPVLEDIKQYSYEFSSAKKELAVAALKEQSLFSWNKEYPVLEPKLARIRALYINPETPVKFLRFLEETAQDCDGLIDVSFLSIQEPKQDFCLSLSNFKLSLVGHLPDCLRFLDKLENAPYLIEVQSLDIVESSGPHLKTGEDRDFSFKNIKMSLLIRVMAVNSPHEN